MATVVDAKGLACPQPVIMAKQELAKHNDDFMMEVDNPAAAMNLEKLAASQGCKTLVDREGEIYRVSFIRGAKPVVAAVQEPDPTPVSRTGKWAVFCGRDRIGDGSEELGQSLIKMYFYTILQSESLPASILFMNSGVKLPALQEQVVEHLLDLQKKGVEILVCGTCLNYFGIQDQLKVGVVSNMYDITQQMEQADKVISL